MCQNTVLVFLNCIGSKVLYISWAPSPFTRNLPYCCSDSNIGRNRAMVTSQLPCKFLLNLIKHSPWISKHSSSSLLPLHHGFYKILTHELLLVHNVFNQGEWKFVHCHRHFLAIIGYPIVPNKAWCWNIDGESSQLTFKNVLKLGMVAPAYSPTYFGGWSRRIIWTQEFEAGLSNITNPVSKK
jgi:hypothetical protein